MLQKFCFLPHSEICKRRRRRGESALAVWHGNRARVRRARGGGEKSRHDFRLLACPPAHGKIDMKQFTRRTRSSALRNQILDEKCI